MAGSPLHAVPELGNVLVSTGTLLFGMDKLRFQGLNSGSSFPGVTNG